jgi:hypothetical protein
VAVGGFRSGASIEQSPKTKSPGLGLGAQFFTFTFRPTFCLLKVNLIGWREWYGQKTLQLPRLISGQGSPGFMLEENHNFI